jgi:hypothetical protein
MKKRVEKPAAPTDLWERLDAAVAAAGLAWEIPPDAFTAKQFGEREGINAEVARGRLNGMVRAGVLERGGTTRIWYRLKEQK